MSKGGLLLLAIVIWQIGTWAFAPPRPPPTIPEGDGRAFGSNEKYLVEARESQRQSAIRALDRTLLSGFYVVPLFYLKDQWLAYSSDLKRPDRTPLMGTSIDTWWRQPH